MQDVADIFRSLGKLTEVAKILGCNPSTVGEMKRRGSIPVRYWPDLLNSERGQEIGLTPQALMHAHTREGDA